MLPFATKDGQIGIVDAFLRPLPPLVTGLVVFDTFTKFTLFGQIIDFAANSSMGGLGLVTLTSFLNLAIGKRMGFKRMRLASESGNASDISQSGHP